jgi:hypothetical protein
MHLLGGLDSSSRGIGGRDLMHLRSAADPLTAVLGSTRKEKGGKAPLLTLHHHPQGASSVPDSAEAVRAV